MMLFLSIASGACDKNSPLDGLIGLTGDPETEPETEPSTTIHAPDTMVADHTVVDELRLGRISLTDIQSAKTKLHIAYGHTSHGSQLIDGMNGLAAFAEGSGCKGAYAGNEGLFTWNRGGTGGALDLREGDGYGTGDMDHDCGYYPNWVNETRAYLEGAESEGINVIIWSWCGQAAGYSEADMVSAYLTPMSELEAEYPDIVFVYMTCHLNGTGIEGNLHLRNEQIRAFCAANGKWLYDFADIESYDPEGNGYLDKLANDACYWDSSGNGSADGEGTDPATAEDRNWALEWQESHTVNEDWYDCPAAHSQSLNANMKAYAAWWLWTRIAAEL
jgi:hypothetical protein